MKILIPIILLFTTVLSYGSSAIYNEAITATNSFVWTNETGNASFTIENNNLEVTYSSQSMPEYEADTVRIFLPSNVIPEEINFEFTAIDHPPSSLRFYFYSKSGRSWGSMLLAPLVDVAYIYQMQLTYSEEWFPSVLGSDINDFNEDVRNITSIGVYMVRHSSTIAQSYDISNFTVSGELFVDDADKDMMPDAWEDSYGLDPLDYNDAILDSDGDGSINYAEYIAGSDPLDPLSVFSISSIVLSGNTVQIQWSSIEDRIYEVWSTESLINKFELISGQILATPPINTYYDAPYQLDSSTNITVRGRFYRISIIH
jgi:hypothetical protein